MNRFVGIAQAGVALVLLVGCAGPIVSSVLLSSEPTSSVSAESTTRQPAPEQIFGGDCSAIVGDNELSNILGGDVTLSPSIALDLEDVTVRQGGGVRCSWSEAGEVSGAVLSALVVPAASGITEQEPYCYGSSYGQGSKDTFACSFTTIDSGYAFSGVAYPVPQASEEQALTATEALIAAFSDVAATVDAFPPAEPPTGAWPALTDCEALGADPTVAAIYDPAAYYAGPGNGASELPPALYELESIAGALNCWWTIDGDAPRSLPDLAVTGVAGAAWLESDITAAPGVESVNVPGVDTAYVVPGIDDATTLWVIDGVNVAAFDVISTDAQLADIYPAVAPILAAIDTQR